MAAAHFNKEALVSEVILHKGVSTLSDRVLPPRVSVMSLYLESKIKLGLSNYWCEFYTIFGGSGIKLRDNVAEAIIASYEHEVNSLKQVTSLVHI